MNDIYLKGQTKSFKQHYEPTQAIGHGLNFKEQTKLIADLMNELTAWGYLLRKQ